jgi:hypothetical protein
MTKRQSEIYRQKNRLNHQGWNIEDTTNALRFNGGSETLNHVTSKCVAAKVAIDAGYRVQSEVQTENGDECDILAFGLEDRRPVVIELENGLTEGVAERKRRQYTIGDVRECYIIDLDNAPSHPDSLYEHIAEQTGLV